MLVDIIRQRKQLLRILHLQKQHKLSRNAGLQKIREMSLSDFLADTKNRYLTAIQEGKGREWAVAMGNEAGDLDSIASSIAYSWFSSTVQNRPCAALLQTPRNDLELRPENIYAFQFASVSPGREELLCIDDIPSLTPFPSNRFVLVDHNHLLPRFHDQNEDVRVVAILDHHDDEGLYKDTADPRIIAPTGSASSIVAQYIAQSTEKVPFEVARLLLCAILVDTGGLVPGGKAEELDRAAAAYLLPQAQLPTISNAIVTSQNVPAVFELSRDLLERKVDVAQLSTKGLLRRDYKQYAWSAKMRTVQVGLTTVPLDLHIWLSRGPLEDFWREVDSFINEHDLDVLGILTTFRGEKKSSKNNLGGGGDKNVGRVETKHRRQIMLIIRDVPGGDLERRLCAGLEVAAELALKRRSLLKFAPKHREGDSQPVTAMDAGINNTQVHIYKQGNAKVTRKITAPLMKRIIEEDAGEN